VYDVLFLSFVSQTYLRHQQQLMHMQSAQIGVPVIEVGGHAPVFQASPAMPVIASRAQTTAQVSEAIYDSLCRRAVLFLFIILTYHNHNCRFIGLGHGMCVSLKEMARMSNALPLAPNTYYEGDSVRARNCDRVSMIALVNCVSYPIV
jgi:hypothetical protein